MDTSGDLHDEEGMVALCFEKNTFLDVVLLPEECRTQQTSGHRRCNSDSTHGRTPQELLALSGDVAAWPEISTLALGMMPAGDQESCFKTSVASRTVGNDGDKCKEEQEIDEWTSESNTFQWDSQDGGAMSPSPVSVAERGKQAIPVAEWASEGSHVEWDSQQGGRCPMSPVSMALRGKPPIPVDKWTSEGSTVEWQSQQGGRCPMSPVSVAQPGKQAIPFAEWASEGSAVEWESQQGGRCPMSPVSRAQAIPLAEWASEGSSVTEWASEGSNVEWQSQQGGRCQISLASIAERRESQDSALGWANLRQTHANSPVPGNYLGDIRFGLDTSPMNYLPDSYAGAFLGIGDQTYGNATMRNTVPRNHQRVLVGSLGHATGTCRPCAHIWRVGGCSKGDQCKRCHLCDEAAFRDYRQDHRRFARAVKRAGKRGQYDRGASASAAQANVATGSSSVVRQLTNATPSFAGPPVPRQSAPSRW